MHVELRDTIDRDRALEYLRAAEPHLGGDRLQACLEGAQLLDVLEGHCLVGAVAVRVRRPYATITVAATAGEHLAAQLATLEDGLRAQGVTHLALFTERPGLVRKMLAKGFRIRECEMEKVV